MSPEEATSLWEAMIKNNVARYALNKLLGDALAVHVCPACKNTGYKKTGRGWPAPTFENCHCEHGQSRPSWATYSKEIDDDIPF